MRLWICWAILTLLCQSLGATICKPDVDDLCCSGYIWNNSSGRCENKDTVQTEKSGQIGAKNFSEEGHTEGSTDVSPSSPIKFQGSPTVI
uniref:Uncharacterized protein LOC111102985 isoform X2 n=1 Tax=Crassostrea virginica TaxID=6565 RepID=A0A8B8ANH2_CRAVI|nr:uncharacterized protein LOC111102985 isoform X2 [Crassostrea virginica]